jgi:glycosyltransferase involved in cell wall biosynthesis
MWKWDREIIRTWQTDDCDASVTVTITLYNYSRFIGATLDSVVAQSLGPLQLVVVDDASSDDSVDEVLKHLENSHARFERAEVARLTSNRGLAGCRNAAVDLARTPYCFILDADNLLYPRAIERCLEALEISEAGAAYAQCETFSDPAIPLGFGYAAVFDKERLAGSNYIDAMSLIRKSSWAEVDGYSECPAMGWEDYDFWCKYAEHDIKTVFVPEILFRYRVHEQSMLRQHTNEPKQQRDLGMFFYLRHPWIDLPLP